MTYCSFLRNVAYSSLCYDHILNSQFLIPTPTQIRDSGKKRIIFYETKKKVDNILQD